MPRHLSLSHPSMEVETKPIYTEEEVKNLTYVLNKLKGKGTASKSVLKRIREVKQKENLIKVLNEIIGGQGAGEIIAEEIMGKGKLPRKTLNEIVDKSNFLGHWCWLLKSMLDDIRQW